MRKAYCALVLLFLAILLAACAAEPSTSDTENGSLIEEPPSPEAPAAEREAQSKNTLDDRGVDRQPGNAPTANPQNPVSLDKADSVENIEAPVERKIIRNADLQLESVSPDAVQQKISSIAEAKKGFVIQSRRSSSKIRNREGDTVVMSIRVPADKFSETLAEIRKTADRIIDESVTGRDVTEEFIDIEARLKTKKALEEQFLEIMKQSKSVQDALNVQRQLAAVRGEIEQIEGRKRFLENQASLSTIKVQIKTPTAISGSSSGFFYELKDAVRDGFDAALGFVLIMIRVLIAIIPFLLLVVLPILLVLRYLWRNYKKKRLAKKIADEIKEEKLED